MADIDQEKYLSETSFKDIVVRGLKKFMLEFQSMKTLFLAFICVAVAENWITDMWGIIGGLATLGVRELPSNIFETIVNKFGSGGK